jgi:large subunit ribosomal protein L22
MQIKASAVSKYIRTSAQKTRLVANEVRGKKVGAALNLLQFSIQKDVARDVEKAIKSAVANLEDKNSDLNIDADDLVVDMIKVDEGPVLKRFQAKAQGRAGRILKRMCHISVTVSN